MLNRKLLGMFVFMLGSVALVATGYAEGGEAVRADLTEKVKMWLAISAGFGMAIASFGGALSQARAISSALTGIARNPAAQGKIFIPMIVGLALIESLILLSFLVTNGLKGLI